MTEEGSASEAYATVGDLIAQLRSLAARSPLGEGSPLVARHRQPRWDYPPRVWEEPYLFVPSLVDGSIVMQDVTHPATDPQFFHHRIPERG